MFYGAKSIVYPIRQEADSVQWHFESRKPLSGVNGAIGVENPRLMVDDLGMLQCAKRHFLGLWADCRVTLGTDHSDLTNITWSRSQEVRTELTSDSITIGGLLAMPKIITFTGSKTYKYAKGRKSIYSTNFEGKMASLMDVPAMLYSPSERRCWMVPILNVILHLARVRANYQSILGIDIPPCHLVSNGGKAAFQVIQQFCRNPFRDDSLDEDERRKERAAFIEDYINQVWIALDCKTYLAKRYFKTEIFGYEMADIAKVKTGIQMKRHRLKSSAAGWTPLLDGVSLALFYEGLYDPIIPCHGEHSDNSCTKNTLSMVPYGYDLLMATIPCLRYFAERYNNRDELIHLTSKYQWHCPGNRDIFAPCRKHYAHECNFLQELRVGAWLSKDDIRSPSQSSIQRNLYGAVLFRYHDNAQSINQSLNATHTFQKRPRRAILPRPSSPESEDEHIAHIPRSDFVFPSPGHVDEMVEANEANWSRRHRMNGENGVGNENEASDEANVRGDRQVAISSTLPVYADDSEYSSMGNSSSRSPRRHRPRPRPHEQWLATLPSHPRDRPPTWYEQDTRPQYRLRSRSRSKRRRRRRSRSQSRSRSRSRSKSRSSTFSSCIPM